MSTPSTDRLRVAVHESGHLVAAHLTGVTWLRAELDPPDHPHLEGAVWLSNGGNFEIPVVRGFIAWAGAWAESRYSGTPLAQIIESDRCVLDRQEFEYFRQHHAVDRPWGDLLAPHWPVVLRAAAALAIDATLLPNDLLPDLTERAA